MHLMRESWTDARLDDFAKHTDQRFDAVDMRFDAVDRRFDAVDKRFDQVEAELRALNGRFDALNRTLLQVGGGIVVALIGVILTQI
ncbi:MAG TPA: hypothetical protein VNP96_03130 [Solirubrobacterales bacterium]|nr:hypothetical protein [Solirubrobacterales bacterium]